MTSMKAICNSIRNSDKERGLFGEFSGLKMSALNDAVSKALTGKPYSQIVAAERAGHAPTIKLPARHLAEVADEYAVDREKLASAISMAYLKLFRSNKSESYQDRFGDKYFPFPEHEAALYALESCVNEPVNGRHVALVGDYTCGISTILKHFRFKQQPDAYDPRAPDYFGRFVTTRGIGPRLDDWAQALYLSMLNLDYLACDWDKHNLRGKPALYEGVRLAKHHNVDTVLVEEITGPMKRDYGQHAQHFGKGLQAFAKHFPFRLVMGCSPDMKLFRICAPTLAATTSVIHVAPLQDSSVLRQWISHCDMIMDCSGYGEYDDEMVSAILSVSKGNTLLVHRYVRKAAELAVMKGYSRNELRRRVVQLTTIGSNINTPHPWAVDNFLEFGKFSKQFQRI